MSLGLQKYKNLFPGVQGEAWRLMANAMDGIAAKIGIADQRFIDALLADPQSNYLTAAQQAPPQAQFAVAGQDGKFTIAIENPQNALPISAGLASAYAAIGLNTWQKPLLHNLQSCTTVDFDLAHGVSDYGNSPQLVHHYQIPNSTLFWRLRSSFDGKLWNKWQIYGNATIACGPIGVYSGLLRTAALAQTDASYGPTSNPLSAASGAMANQSTITIGSFQVQYPFGLRTYNSGSITPLLDSTKYYVYCLDPTYAAGAVSYIATVNSQDLTALDSVVMVGPITTPAFGGGPTQGTPPLGGGGPCFTGNTRVITRKGIKRISDIVVGDEILTQRGWRKVAKLLIHQYDGPMHAMGEGEYVTPMHSFWHELDWERAKNIFERRRAFSGWVFNLEILGDGSDEEQCYTLANGRIAHNSFYRK